MRRRLATTLVCLVDEPGTDHLQRLAEAANVRVVQPDTQAAALDRAVEAWRVVSGTHVPFTVTDADPLAAVRAAWTHRFEIDARNQPAPAGELEVAVNETLLRWRAGSLELPDFYVLNAVDELPALDRHWYLGVLGGTCARRVVLAGASLLVSLRRLPSGPWWPELDRVLSGVERAVPEDVGRPGRGEDSGGAVIAARPPSAGGGAAPPASDAGLSTGCA